MKDKTFRLFVSSTFEDFKEERRILNAEVYRKISHLCEEKGYHFELVDLRWGISSEAARNHKTVRICLNEIQKCQDGPKPNILIMVGERYGWVPLPYSISESVWMRLIDVLLPKEKILVSRWYGFDENSIEREYILRPRTGIWVNDEKWGEIESRLRNILQQASLKCMSPEEAREFCFVSLTEKEIQKGFLDDTDFSEHAIVYFRDNCDSELPIETEHMRRRIREKMAAGHLEKRIISMDSGSSSSGQFAQIIIERLSELINAQIEYLEQSEREMDCKMAVRQFAGQYAEEFFGRQQELNQLKQYLQGTDKRIQFVAGDSGSGKTSLLCRLYQQIDNEYCFADFSGAEGSSVILLNTLNNLIRQIREQMDISEYPIQYHNAARNFWKMLSEAGKQGKQIVLLIDALDQYTDRSLFRENIFDCYLPDGVKMIISVTEDTAEEVCSFYHSVLKLGAFSEEESRELLDRYLGKRGRRLCDAHRNMVSPILEKGCQPIQIRLLSELCRQFHSFDDLNLEDGSQEGLVCAFLDSMSYQAGHSSMLVNMSMALLAVAPDGLTVEEMRNRLMSMPEVLNECFELKEQYEELADESRDILPAVYWTRLAYDLGECIRTVQTSDYAVLKLGHSVFYSVLQKHRNNELKYADRNLLDLFMKMDNYTHAGEINRRKAFSLIPLYQQNHMHLSELLTDAEFMHCLVATGQMEYIIGLWSTMKLMPEDSSVFSCLLNRHAALEVYPDAFLSFYRMTHPEQFTDFPAFLPEKQSVNLKDDFIPYPYAADSVCKFSSSGTYYGVLCGGYLYIWKTGLRREIGRIQTGKIREVTWESDKQFSIETSDSGVLSYRIENDHLVVNGEQRADAVCKKKRIIVFPAHLWKKKGMISACSLKDQKEYQTYICPPAVKNLYKVLPGDKNILFVYRNRIFLMDIDSLAITGEFCSEDCHSAVWAVKDESFALISGGCLRIISTEQMKKVHIPVYCTNQYGKIRPLGSILGMKTEQDDIPEKIGIPFGKMEYSALVQPENQADTLNDYVTMMSFSSDGKYAAAYEKNGRIDIGQTHGGQILWQFSGYHPTLDHALLEMTFSPFGDYLLLVYSHRLVLLDLVNCQPVKICSQKRKKVRRIFFTVENHEQKLHLETAKQENRYPLGWRKSGTEGRRTSIIEKRSLLYKLDEISNAFVCDRWYYSDDAGEKGCFQITADNRLIYHGQNEIIEFNHGYDLEQLRQNLIFSENGLQTYWREKNDRNGLFHRFGSTVILVVPFLQSVFALDMERKAIITVYYHSAGIIGARIQEDGRLVIGDCNGNSQIFLLDILKKTEPESEIVIPVRKEKSFLKKHRKTFGRIAVIILFISSAVFCRQLNHSVCETLGDEGVLAGTSSVLRMVYQEGVDCYLADASGYIGILHQETGDFDKDGREETLVIRLEPSDDEYVECRITASMYRKQWNGKLRLQDFRVISNLELAEMEGLCDLYTFETDGVWMLGISKSFAYRGLADTSPYNENYICQYKNGRFQKVYDLDHLTMDEYAEIGEILNEAGFFQETDFLTDGNLMADINPNIDVICSIRAELISDLEMWALESVCDELDYGILTVTEGERELNRINYEIYQEEEQGNKQKVRYTKEKYPNDMMGYGQFETDGGLFATVYEKRMKSQEDILEKFLNDISQNSERQPYSFSINQDGYSILYSAEDYMESTWLKGWVYGDTLFSVRLSFPGYMQQEAQKFLKTIQETYQPSSEEHLIYMGYDASEQLGPYDGTDDYVEKYYRQFISDRLIKEFAEDFDDETWEDMEDDFDDEIWEDMEDSFDDELNDDSTAEKCDKLGKEFVNLAVKLFADEAESDDGEDEYINSFHGFFSFASYGMITAETFEKPLLVLKLNWGDDNYYHLYAYDSKQNDIRYLGNVKCTFLYYSTETDMLVGEIMNYDEASSYISISLQNTGISLVDEEFPEPPADLETIVFEDITGLFRETKNQDEPEVSEETGDRTYADYLHQLNITCPSGWMCTSTSAFGWCAYYLEQENDYSGHSLLYHTLEAVKGQSEDGLSEERERMEDVWTEFFSEKLPDGYEIIWQDNDAGYLCYKRVWEDRNLALMGEIYVQDRETVENFIQDMRKIESSISFW